MKKHFTLIFTLFLILLQISASAQGEWKWAHYWSGGDGSYGDYFNNITNTAFDEEGNIYVYGTMGGNPTIDGMTFQFINNGEVLSYNEKAIMLAKFDTLGNMLWHKVVKSSSSPSFPLWMEVRNDQVYVAGNSSMYEDRQDSWLYYMDTLVRKWQVDNIPEEQQQFPFKPYHRWTFFAQFDLDGNLIEDHFVEAITRDYYFNGTDTVRHQSTLCANDISPVHICNDGSICVFTTIEYNESEERPYTIIVDGDTNKTYQLYFPGSTVPPANIWNAIEYKFTPDWELDFAKLLVDHTDGIAPIIVNGQDTVNDYFFPYIKGMVFDNEDNIFLTGYISIAQWMPGSGGELNNFPIHIWWDDTHNTTINDISSAGKCNFILKFNSNGEVLWSNQLYTRSDGNMNELPNCDWAGIDIAGNSVFVLGRGFYNTTSSSLVYFDNETNFLNYYGENPAYIGFFVRYDSYNGTYINQGIIPSSNPSMMHTSLCVLNNRVLCKAGIGELVTSRAKAIVQWRSDGTFIKADTLNMSQNALNAKISINDNGCMLFSFQFVGGTALFSNNIEINTPPGNSSAVVAYYYDPSLAEPLPEDSTGIADRGSLSRAVVRAYPNPTTDKVTVEVMMPLEDGEIYLGDVTSNFTMERVTVTDLAGKVVLQRAVSGTRAELDFSALPAGTYIITASGEMGQWEGKVVKK